ncbi:uncharacterized protein FFB20_07593 [Fusarium fujikuroi]|uniref:Uncharacterized protein n=2 Tax=Fusarium fujikuroi TaxID=5127 RepID=S0DZ02_GIBF5|nr:uncharacterized protein FFUJ_14617 [Fusarium fujikuroi IMI 58289]KLO93829.1 uncharacterized protein Y057_14415 [Fusarium fujikuroi]KLP21949.1 uncharacterized protein LW94_14160 [Fusarium fujikuroi]CCT67650.1 uncharacterized protein FFUJ_14617 [Fusarium fujikuroi IMI 58289]SCN86269.1 uncharacterized protein FFB20_07593 [Fusarium fujikuroi]SCN89455.1 uncharacterized protein FFC1_05751 [Fusarium fujikuroi]
MLVLPFILALSASAITHAHGVLVERSENHLIKGPASPDGASSSSMEPLWHAKQQGDGVVKLDFHRLIQRRDTSSADSGTSAEATSKATKDTSAVSTTEYEATTTAEADSTTLKTAGSGTEASTTEESSVSSTTSTSTSTSSTVSSTSTTSTSTEPGASCYSTTVKSSTICETTGLTTLTCYAANITSSTCSPGLLCATQSSDGVTICMELQNEVGTAGIIIASVFSALILICACTLMTMCYRDKSKQRRQEELRRVRSVKIAERATLLQSAQ